MRSTWPSGAGSREVRQGRQAVVGRDAERRLGDRRRRARGRVGRAALLADVRRRAGRRCRRGRRRTQVVPGDDRLDARVPLARCRTRRRRRRSARQARSPSGRGASRRGCRRRRTLPLTRALLLGGVARSAVAATHRPIRLSTESRGRSSARPRCRRRTAVRRSGRARPRACPAPRRAVSDWPWPCGSKVSTT